VHGLFEFLFKYRPVVFEEGAFAFAPSRGALVVGLLAVAAALVAAWGYRRARARDGSIATRDRLVLAGLRVGALALLAACLFRPMVVLSAAVPQRNVVGVVIDDSRSMRIADEGGRARADVVRQLVGGRDSALLAALAQRFVVRTFRASGAAPADSSLAFDASRTRLGDALVGAAGELAGAPLSGLVLLSDGADNSMRALEEPIATLRSRGVAVYTVGLGRESLSPDVEVARVEAPRTVLEGTSLVATVTVTQRGYAGRPVDLVVEDGGRIVSTQRVTLGKDGAPTPVRVRIPTTEPGPRAFTVRVAAQPREVVTQNNARDVVVTVRRGREKILYVEGEPRFELKFLRRAVENDSTIQVVSLLRSAEQKYLRLGVDDSLELAAGFPRTREELFQYKGIILGSIEASAFTLDQLRMIADFVSDRGGGLLALGGRHALAEGGFAGTPVADALPVALDAPTGAPIVVTELAVEPTAAGLLHPATQIGATEDSSAARWKTLPPLTAVNRVGALKPGASALLIGRAPQGGDPSPVLAWQRYGRGKAIVLPVQDTWLWQMHASIPVADLTHERLWRQMLRWLVSDVPGRVVATTSTDDAAPGDGVEVRAEVSDARWVRANGADAIARVTAPSGAVTETPLEWSVTRDGEYAARFVPRERGAHRVEVIARLGRDTLASEPTFVQVRESSAEWFDAGQHRELLERIARETGGRYYASGDALSLPRDIVYSARGNVVMERMDLWDMPVVFLLLVALLGGEWAYRRARGLA
jgi:uncharacterized membrane protein